MKQEEEEKEEGGGGVRYPSCRMNVDARKLRRVYQQPEATVAKTKRSTVFSMGDSTNTSNLRGRTGILSTKKQKNSISEKAQRPSLGIIPKTPKTPTHEHRTCIVLNRHM